jgi:serine/threonine-protein kinase
MANPKFPAQIGRYQIVDRLGEGGMGVLYLASDPLLQRTVAIKVLSVQSDELRERFAREARSAASLKHNHIVTIYDVGDDGGHPFLAMEYLDGETMAEVIRRRAPLGIVRKLQLLLQLCDGLGYAHRTGIIHRDIKPANLMITSEGVLKILDFGLARLTTETTSAGLTRVGVLIGTPHYMSPEQIQGGFVDQRSDIFAVGLVAYEFLAYKKAYPGDAPHVVLDKILHSQPQPLSELRPELEPRLTAAVNKAIQKNPDHRYDTLAALALDLTRIRDHLIAQDATVRVDRVSIPEGTSPRPTGRDPRTPSAGSPNIPNYQAIAQRRSAQIAQHLARAQEFFDAQDYQAAIDQCEQAAVLDPDDSRVIEVLQRAHRAADDKQVAQWLSEAQALLTQGLLSEADRLIDESLQRRPNSAEAQALQQQVRARRREQERAAERDRAAQSAVARARMNLEEGALEAAIRCATEALAHDPGREDALALRAQAQGALAERRKKEELEERAHEAVANARDLAAGDELAEALRSLRAFEPAHPIVEEAIVQLEAEAAARERRRREEEAERERQRAAEKARRREEERRAREEEEARRREGAAFKETARAAQAEQRFGEALKALDRAREILPDDSEIDSMIAAVTQARHDAEEAERRQRTADQHVTHARAHLERGEAAAAQRLVSAALEAVPEHPTALQLRDRTRAMLNELRRAEQLKRQANAAAGAARRLFVTGDYQGAVRLLEAFAPRELVESVLQEIHTEWRRQEQRRAEAEERKRLEEEAARATLEAQQRTEAEARAEAERVARAEAEKGERERVAAEKAAAEAAAAEERRRLDEERHRAAIEARAKAEKAERERIAAAKAAAEAAAAEERRRLDEERKRTEAEARAKAEKAERERIAAAKAAAEAAAAEERRRLDEERKRTEAEARARAAKAERERIARDEAAQRQAQEAIEQRARDQERAQTEVRVFPVITPKPRRSRRWIGIAAAVGISVAAIGGWWIYRNSLARPATSVESPTTTSVPIAPPVPPPNPAPAGPSAVETARSKFDAGDLSGAAAALSAATSPADQATLDLIGRIRTAAADGSRRARSRAESDGAAGNAAFKRGAQKEAEAAALTQSSDINKVVDLYKEAEAEYSTASSAAADLGQLVRSAADALRKGDMQRALTDAERAFGRDPGAKPVIDLLASIRGTAQKTAAAARNDAVAQGAENSAAFKEADGKRQSAEKITDLRQTRQQVSAFADARDLYASAAREAGTRRTAAREAIGSARAALGRGDLQAAERSLNDAVTAQPDVEGAAAIRDAIDAARKKLATAKPAPPTTPPPAPAPTPTKPPAATPPAVSPTLAADRAAVIETLQAYANAYGRLSADEVVKVAPYLAGEQANLANSFRNLRSYSMKIEGPQPVISEDGMSASVRCTITRDSVTRTSGATPTRTGPATVTLRKRDGRWVITNIQTSGG